MNPLPIAKPPWTGLGKRLESALRKAIFDHQMLIGKEKIAIALSGGKDSLTLLFLLAAALGRGLPDAKLYALHVSGAFSCGASLQEKWLSDICEALSIPFFSLVQEGSEPKECYSCSRVRRKLLFDKAKSLGIDTIAFGHHRDDNAQTLLMNLFQKGEFAGILPKIEMVRYGITIIRPLIYMGEGEIREFAKENGFLRLTCQCPIGAKSMRKKIEKEISALEELFPHVRGNLSHASLIYGSKKALELEE